MTVLFSISLSLTAGQIKGQTKMLAKNDTLTRSVLIHPPMDGIIATHEHTYKPKLRLGDQLGRDFTVSKLTEKGFAKRYKNDGESNEDWYGWRKDVLAPFKATVTRVQEPDTTNKPGQMNRDARPGLIFFKRNDGLKVVYAHVREIEVEKGEQVAPGQVVAKVGNNGNSRNPHVHVGAWKGKSPYQIQVDLYADKRYNKGYKKTAKD